MASNKTLPELVEKLKSEDNGKYVYRGQNRIWPAPLVPSLYRDILDTDKTIDFLPHQRLRNAGAAFHLQDILKFSQQVETKKPLMQMNGLFRDMFGYPIAQLMLQQFGYNSDSLDVTTDPLVAAFFSKFDFQTKNYIQESSHSGVIYRWPVERNPVDADAIRSVDFYTCPPFLDGIDTLKLIATDPTSYWTPSLMQENANWYFHNINTNWSKGEPRPFDLLNLPYAIFMEGRIALQSAGLLFVDMILSESFSVDSAAPRDKLFLKGGAAAVEDLSKRPGAECFQFIHKKADSEVFDRSPESFFPSDDPFRTIIFSCLGFGSDIKIIQHALGAWLNIDAPPVYDPFIEG
jgi:hypothetical protein